MARASNKPPDALPRIPSKKKTPSKTKDATQNAQLMTPAQDTPGPSTNSLLAQTVLTTDQWVLLCQGDFWKLNEGKQKWEGNPVFQSDFKVYFESLKNRQKRTATVVQALPMLPADMKVLMDYLDTSEASKNIAEELINFKYGDVRMCQESAAGHSYRIPFQKSMPEIDCYTHFVNWIQYLEFQLQRPIDASDYVFPTIASTGKLKFGEPLSRAGFESIMEQIVDNSGIMIGRNGKFTTHCFRRGGAQYHFMWAEHKWSLKAVKWWGGWSSGEEVNTIMRYLLDGPFVTEDQREYPDRMLTEQTPRRSKGRYSPCGTPQVLQPLPSLFQQLQSAQEAIPQTPQRIQAGYFPYEPPTQLQPLLSLFPHLELDQDDVANAPMEMLAPQRSAADICDTYIQPTPPFHAITPRIPKTSTMDDVIKYWTKGHPPQGLPGPLCDWPEQFERKAWASEAVKFSQIKILYEEYMRLGGSKEAFDKEYPNLWTRYTVLLKAVRVARERRGDTKSRRRGKR
ncbi:hypothetical protein BDN71DRAFT_1435024 [Pleurotus eryngii]|uniref:Uncharacterized protein n=1 Tax=Pleurotus eryngii TaxID=5323 RepID=A0A9P6DAR8_PLEER|nr:hypothetical protein BDN71DRAFT_1435024 [Pleurotus eryngii]